MAVNDLTHTNTLAAALNLNDGTTYTLLNMGAIYDLRSEVVKATVPRQTPVAIYQANNMQIRELAIELSVYGATLSAYITNRRALVTHFWPNVRKSGGLGTLAYTTFNSNVRYATVAFVGLTTGEEWVPNTTAACWGVVTLRFEMLDPTWYGAAVTPSGTFNANTPVNVSCANAGDCDAYPTITITGSAVDTVNPQVTDAYGNVLAISNTIEEDDVLVITCNPNSASITFTPDGGAATSWWGYRTAASVLPLVKYGTNNLTFVADSGTAAIAISFNSRYSSHG